MLQISHKDMNIPTMQTEMKSCFVPVNEHTILPGSLSIVKDSTGRGVVIEDDGEEEEELDALKPRQSTPPCWISATIFENAIVVVVINYHRGE